MEPINKTKVLTKNEIVELKDRDPFIVLCGKVLLVFGCLTTLFGLFFFGIPMIFGAVFMIYCTARCPHCKKYVRVSFNGQDIHKCKKCKKEFKIKWL